MSRFHNFSSCRPTEPGWYWVINMSILSEPEIVLVRPINFNDPNSSLGFQRFGSPDTRPLNSVTVDVMQWQKADWR